MQGESLHSLCFKGDLGGGAILVFSQKQQVRPVWSSAVITDFFRPGVILSSWNMLELKVAWLAFWNKWKQPEVWVLAENSLEAEGVSGRMLMAEVGSDQQQVGLCSFEPSVPVECLMKSCEA